MGQYMRAKTKPKLLFRANCENVMKPSVAAAFSFRTTAAMTSKTASCCDSSRTKKKLSQLLLIKRKQINFTYRRLSDAKCAKLCKYSAHVRVGLKRIKAYDLAQDRRKLVWIALVIIQSTLAEKKT